MVAIEVRGAWRLVRLSVAPRVSHVPFCAATGDAVFYSREMLSDRHVGSDMMGLVKTALGRLTSIARVRSVCASSARARLPLTSIQCRI